ncbi:MAG TPA: hypothetical protein VKX16_12025 [Chloroflexota bacterium]|nr:hypothetical protein [Chloroflexota bacterium]
MGEPGATAITYWEVCPVRAVRLMVAELAERPRTKPEAGGDEAIPDEEICERQRAALGVERCSRAWTEREAMDLGSAVAYALVEPGS